MRSGENRFHPDNLDAIFAALDEIEGAEGGPSALVLTGEGKFFSNGLDLEWMGRAEDAERERSLGRVHGLFARILTFPSFTVAAINGHAFAAGAMLALACDQRVMREDRGFFCLPEVDLGIPFTGGMSALITGKLPLRTTEEAMLTGRRYGGPDAVSASIVDEAVAEGRGRRPGNPARRRVAGKPAHAVTAIKKRLYQRAVEQLAAGTRKGEA